MLGPLGATARMHQPPPRAVPTEAGSSPRLDGVRGGGPGPAGLLEERRYSLGKKGWSVKSNHYSAPKGWSQGVKKGVCSSHAWLTPAGLRSLNLF